MKMKNWFNILLVIIVAVFILALMGGGMGIIEFIRYQPLGAILIALAFFGLYKLYRYFEKKVTKK